MMTDLSELERAMLKRLAEQEGPHFCHQTRDEVSLSVEEKVNLAGDLLRRNPGEFLARHYRFLCWPEDAECFRDLWDNYTVRYYLKEVVGVSPPSSASADAEAVKVECEALRRKRKLRAKNRRLVALRRMEAEARADPTEGFFSDEQMRERAPELWEHMVGRYLSDTDRRALLGHQYESFSGMLLSQLLDNEERPNRLADNPEGDSDDSEDAEFNRDRWKPRKPSEQERSRQEFREIMHSHFLAGLDEEFNYDAIDNDSALDDEMEELVRDAEEIYFDSESPSAAPPDDHSDLAHGTNSTRDRI
ncbi:Coiled-coil domain-containing protein 97 [Taenia crassiceps]|uniref:Coiled-coil domain-containing protein 97 n=1 Tax=Taenia crassiceps TaxID=6207 RepID=A0ABR4QLH6_9CEST